MKPVLFTLEDLMKTEVKGKFYQTQLRLAPNASDLDFIFEVEKVEKKKLIKGKEFYFVKYLYYPGKVLLIHILIILCIKSSSVNARFYIPNKFNTSNYLKLNYSFSKIQSVDSSFKHCD